MIIIDAIKSGKRFRRKGTDWHPNLEDAKIKSKSGALLDFAPYITCTDIIADDWEIEEHKVTITRTEFYSAVLKMIKKIGLERNEKFIHPSGKAAHPYDVEQFSRWADLAKELGFE